MNRFSIFIGMLLVIALLSVPCYADDQAWERKISLGFNKSNGNTNNTEATLSAEAKKNFNHTGLLFNGTMYYSETDGTMDAQKWDGTGRYSFDFSETFIWFNFYQIKVDHDRFAQVDYRITPSTGIGYWFSKTDDWKAMLEGSFGYEMTRYRDSTPDKDEAVFIARTYLEKQVFDNARLSEDFTATPSLDNFGEYRFTSETAFVNPVSEQLDLNIKYVIEYDSDPASGAKKTDTRIITALTYSF